MKPKAHANKRGRQPRKQSRPATPKRAPKSSKSTPRQQTSWQQDVGSLVGKGLSSFTKWLGIGDYQINKNTVLGLGGQVPSMHTHNDSIIVHHREYIGDLYSTTTFSSVNVPLNPGLSSSFPWLSRIAVGFQEYQILGMVVEYVPELSEVASNELSLGFVTLAAQYRTDLPTYPSNAIALESQFATSGKPNLPLCLGIECDPRMSSYNKWFIRSSTTYVGDVKTFDFVDLNILVGGMQTGSQIAGQIWVSYEIELLRPTALLDPSQLYFAIHDQPPNAGVSSTVPTGVSNVVGYQNNLSGAATIYGQQASAAAAAAADGYSLTCTASTITLTLPRGITGSYLVRMVWNTAGSGSYSMFSAVAYTNCSAVASISGTNYLAVAGTTTTGMSALTGFSISNTQASQGQAKMVWSTGSFAVPSTPFLDVIVSPAN